ncbi:MAG: hypothetical protein CML46_00010 [Rhodobacteraceae bacterium]|nr:hypothetical protein [Paracoccaceae bacterium]MBR25330.1 hypothetical protein [Paracoccaceae bacterium]
MGSGSIPHNASARPTRREPAAKSRKAGKRRIIRRIREGGLLWELHATKGWRSYRLRHAD